MLSGTASGQAAAAQGTPEAVLASASPSDLSAAAQGRSIDPEPDPRAGSHIVASEDIEVAHGPACALWVQYAGEVAQPATWRGERCEALTMRFVDLAGLAAIGQDRKLDADTREAIAGLPGGKVFYVEGAHASAIFAPNEAGLLERHELAD